MNEQPNNVVPMPEPERQQFPTVVDFSPKTLDEALRLSDALANSDIVPKDYQKKPGNCLVAIQWGAELGLKPLQAMQSIAVINGRPGLYGDAGKALLMAKGLIIVEDDSRVIEANQFASCTISRIGRPDVTRTFSMKDAVTAGLWKKTGPWTTAPFRQMAWRAFWFAARDAAADILKGMDGAEALRDLQVMQERDITPAAEQGPEPKKDAALEKAREIKVNLLCEAMDKVKTIDELEKLKADGAKLPEGELRTKAGEHYRKAKLRLTTKEEAIDVASTASNTPASSPAGGPPVTRPFIATAIANAADKEAADLASDLIRHLPEPEDQAALWNEYNAKIATFKP